MLHHTQDKKCIDISVIFLRYNKTDKSLLTYVCGLWYDSTKGAKHCSEKIEWQSTATEAKEMIKLALTRKMLQAMDIPAEKIDEIISAHTETISAIKEERDSFKESAEKLPGVEKALEKANADLEALKAGDWEKKFTDIKAEYESYKTDTETKAVKAAKEAAYKQLLLDAGISDKRIASIMRVSDVDGMKLDKDGKLEEAEKLTENIKTEWADFIATEGKKGAETPAPPAGDGETKTPSVAKQLAEAYQREHYGSANFNKED